MGYKRNLIGVVLTMLGLVLFAITGHLLFSIILFAGIFLFASFPDEAWFFDYVKANSNEVLLRKRCYLLFIPFWLISMLITFGKLPLKIFFKEEYYIGKLNSEERSKTIRISRKEYISLRNEQRNIYSTQLLSKEFMEKTYTEEAIGYERKKTRLIFAILFAIISLKMMFEPDGIFMFTFVVILVPMIILWIPEYKDSKILHKAYKRAVYK